MKNLMNKNIRIYGIIIVLITILFMEGCSNMTSENKEDIGEPKVVNTKKGNTYKEITMEYAKKMMKEEKDYIILDVRTKGEFNEKHIKGAICIPNEDISDKKIGKLPNKEQLILVYCRSGNRSKQASKKLADIGYTNIYEFGGINDWDGDTQ